MDILEEVKVRLGVTGYYHDEALTGFIEDVKFYLKSTGISEETINSDKAVGCIARGVADLWNMGAGQGVWSKVFYERAIQLALEK